METDLIKDARDLLYTSQIESNRDKRKTAVMRNKYKLLQLKTNQLNYEHFKDLWANLHTRLYEENYYITRVVLPNLKDYIQLPEIDIKQIKDGVSIEKLTSQTEEADVTLYKELFSKTNERVYKMLNLAKSIKDTTSDLALKDLMDKAVILFENTVTPCVVDHKKKVDAYKSILT